MHVAPDGTTFALLDEGPYSIVAVDEAGVLLWEYQGADKPNGYIDVPSNAVGLEGGDFLLGLTHLQSATGVATSLVRFDPVEQLPAWRVLVDTGFDDPGSLHRLAATAPDVLIGAGITRGLSPSLYVLGLDPQDGSALWATQTESNLTNRFVVGLAVQPDFGILVAYESIGSAPGLDLLRFDLDGTLVGPLAHPDLAAADRRHARATLDSQGNPILAYFSADVADEPALVVERRDVNFAPLSSSSVAVPGGGAFVLDPIATADDDDAVIAWFNSDWESSIIRVSPDGQEIAEVDPGDERRPIRIAPAADGGLRVVSQQGQMGPAELARYDGCNARRVGT